MPTGSRKLQRNEVISLSTYRDSDGSPAEAGGAPDELAPGTVLLHGQYTIVEYLNSGGFGITYRAKDSLGRPVVIKECFPGVMCLRQGTRVAARSLDYVDELSEMIQSFVREAHNLATLQHKNIVHVHQVFEENDTAYMAIDYIDGMDLLELIDLNPGRLAAKEIVRITKRVLPAIRYIHDMGMLHRDISPDNILIDQNGEPILIDFGASRKTSPSSKRAFSKMKFVKDGYSPQEFYIQGADQGPWSDIYSLGASLYHAISGMPPEDGQKRMSALAQKRPDPYIPLTGRIDGYPPRFLETIDSALKINPKDRIQSATEWMRRMANRSVKSQANYKKIDERADAPAPKAETFVFKTELPDGNEKNIREEILAASRPAVANRSKGWLRLAVLVLLAGAGGAFYTTYNSAAPSDGKNGIAALPELETPAAPTELATVSPSAGASTTPQLPTEGAILSDDAVLAANAETAADRIVFVLPDAAKRPPRVRPENLALSDIAPMADLPSVSESNFRFAPLNATVEEPVFTLESHPNPNLSVDTLPLASAGVQPAANTTPPAAYVSELAPKPALTFRIAGAHWDVLMPFQSDLLRVRNSNTIRIASIDESADLSVSGAWIKEGTTIYTFNGETLAPDTPLSAYVLNNLNIDPDGFVRATVRFRDPDTGTIDRGLLAVPVFRQITFSDGTVTRATVEDLRWILRVTKEPATNNGLKVGDILLGERTTGIGFVSHEDLIAAMDSLADEDRPTAVFEVRRGPASIDVDVPLIRKEGISPDQ